MVKDPYSKTATYPYCGRTVNYRTRSEKKNTSLSSGGGGHSSGGGEGGGYSSGGDGCAGCASIIAIAAIVIAGIPIVLICLLLGEGGISFVGQVIGFIFNILWAIISALFQGI